MLDVSFWRDQLEVSTAPILERASQPGFFAEWIDRLSPRCRNVLASQLGLSEAFSPAARTKAFLRFQDQLVPLVLVDEAIRTRRRSALLEVARAVLSDADMERVRIEASHDARAMAWLLYLRDPNHLLRAIRMDSVHRRGAARLALAEAASLPANVTPNLTAADVAAVVRTMGTPLDPRVDVVETRDSCVVFVKWPVKQAFIAQASENVFGYRREWMVLSFSHDLQRVRIASDIMDLATELAARIASRVFMRAVSYRDESAAASGEVVDRFLASLFDNPQPLPLVEIDLTLPALYGSSRLRLTSDFDASLSNDIRQLQLVYGPGLASLQSVRCLKVLAFHHRVRITFERLGDGVVVRYDEHVLEPEERVQFERFLQNKYDITVLTTERAHAA